MRNKTILMAAAAAAILAGPAMAQVATDADATANVGAAVETPDAAGAVQDTVDSATDAAQGATGAATAEAAPSADVKAGAEVRDPKGELVGTIESVDAQGAVIATGASRVAIPISSIGKNEKGLVIAMTKAELDAAAKAAEPS